VLHAGPSGLPVTVLLQSILKHCFPEESAAREKELLGSSGQATSSQQSDLPIFVMAPLLPGEKIALNIFEPRYRLMIRRCLAGDRRLGITCILAVSTPVSGSTCSHPVGLLCEVARIVSVQVEDGVAEIPEIITQCVIQECQVQPDGRLAIECLAERRVSCSSTWDQDGYRMCKVKNTVEDEVLEAHEHRAFVVCAATHGSDSSRRRMLFHMHSPLEECRCWTPSSLS
jgi:Lon protease-like protein